VDPVHPATTTKMMPTITDRFDAEPMVAISSHPFHP
jgi:hypothetical protein